MLLKNFLQELTKRKNEKGAFRAICRENKISYKKLTPLLKDLGFQYDQKSFEWIYKGKDAAPLDLDLAKKIPMRAAAAQHKQRTKEVHAAKDQIASAADMQHMHGAGLEEEVQHISSTLESIYHLLADQKENAAGIADLDLIKEDQEEAPLPLILQIHRLNQTQKTRKTLNITNDAASWLDQYAETKGHKIGDLVSLAIIQLKKQIDPKS